MPPPPPPRSSSPSPPPLHATPLQVLQTGADIDALLSVEERNTQTEGQNARYKSFPSSSHVFGGDFIYEVGDFVVRIGWMQKGGAVEPLVLVDVEYLPSCSLGEAEELLLEFVQNLVSSFGGLTTAFQNMRDVNGPRTDPDVLTLQSVYGPPPVPSAPRGSYITLPHYFTYKHLALRYLSVIRSLTSPPSRESRSRNTSPSLKTRQLPTANHH
jgi:hypothetical protein